MCAKNKSLNPYCHSSAGHRKNPCGIQKADKFTVDVPIICKRGFTPSSVLCYSLRLYFHVPSKPHIEILHPLFLFVDSLNSALPR